MTDNHQTVATDQTGEGYTIEYFTSEEMETKDQTIWTKFKVSKQRGEEISNKIEEIFNRPETPRDEDIRDIAAFCKTPTELAVAMITVGRSW